jgi:hypothetical protein
VVVLAWLWFGSGGEEAAVRRRLGQLASDINAGTTEGVDTVARAVQIGSYFTDDVVIDLGRGASPIQGRLLVMDMAGRLQPRTGRFTVRVADINVQLAGETAADVELTAEIIPRDESDEYLDAREFKAALSKADGVWRIARVTAVQALR